MKIAEMRSKSVVELQKEAAKSRLKIASLKTDLHIKEVKNPREIRELKRQLATMLTIICEKQKKGEE